IQHYLVLAALAHPNVAFTFIKDGRTVWQLPAVKVENTTASRLNALRERLRNLSGGALQLIPVDFETTVAEQPEEPGDSTPDPSAATRPTLHLWGFIGAPGVSRATRDEQHLFVNRRPVENRALNHALIEGYHTALMKGRFPVCCLFLEVDPAAVDVNIHPSKREVKFRDERTVRGFVTNAIRETLLGFHDQGRSPAEPIASRPAPSQPAEKTSTIEPP